MIRKILVTFTFTLLLTACDSAVLTGGPAVDGNTVTTDPTDTVGAGDPESSDPESGDADSSSPDSADTDTENPDSTAPDADNPEADNPEADNNGGADTVDLIATAEAAGNFTILLTAIEAADLRTTLADMSNINTVFAPTDAAFEALGTDALAALLADSEALQSTLLYHVLAGSNDAAFLGSKAGNEILMLNGQAAAVTDENGQLRINTSNITTADLIASNGIIHAIDAVLTPPADNDPGTDADPTATQNIAQLISNDPQFTTLQLALTSAGLDSTLSQDGAFTLFAPTNEAFDAIDQESLNVLLADPDRLRDVLLYHVVEGDAIDSVAATAAAGTSISSSTGAALSISLSGNALNINNAVVTVPDLHATNGIVHGIDRVLVPPAAPAADTIVAVLSAHPDYSELVSLITQAGLTDTLNDSNATFTLFAPNNAAIANAQATLAAGISGGAAALGSLLLGHVTGVTLTSPEVIARDGTDIEMVFGAQRVSLDRETLRIGSAIVVDPDITAQNGIIHGIDAVLLP